MYDSMSRMYLYCLSVYVNIGSKRKSTDTGLVAQYLSIYLHWYWYQGNQKKTKKKKKERSLWDRSNLFSTPTFFSGKDDIWFGDR